jgi:DNA-binding transcriptional LysR family regulator
MNINFEYYKVFYIIAKNRNITKAANELNITQPSISRMLKTMEEQMNTKLFIRKTKGVILTQEGQELYRLIGDEIENIIKAENNFSKIINDEALKIATNKTYLNYLIDNKKFDFLLKDNHDITFLNTNNFNLLNNQLSNNLIDFALISEPLNFKFDNNIKFKVLDKLHLVFVSNSNNEKINTKPLAILNNSKFNEICNNYIKDYNLTQNGIIKVDDYDNLYPLISNGYANGFLIKEFVINELKNNLICELSPILENNSFKIGILYNINNEIKIEKYFNN